ncbi:PEP-CTERM sorting domain-containing protein [Pelomonas puraquae]|uniref:PEP-CTERM sorting domain-containing protein n=2 Tax=Roseateles puraquae TaxID=431059 RepID=A0A254N2R4_9BURK|nr:PEP-CTERM sorting domain-containing protein [Roseateles puraquae]OWR02455.1 PEP-CTERM sorting domain-containing protein [Roseateles puraquae]
MKANTMTTWSRLAPFAAAATLALAGLGAHATPVVVDVAGAQSRNLLGETGNTVWLIDIGARAAVNALDWDVLLEAFSPSLLSELQVSFGSSSGLDQLTLQPGFGDDASGSGRYSGTLDLTGFGIAAGDDGLLRIEFSELYKDLSTTVADGQWLGGTLTFDVSTSAVPEPGSAALALLGLLGLGAAAVHRRRQTR